MFGCLEKVNKVLNFAVWIVGRVAYKGQDKPMNIQAALLIIGVFSFSSLVREEDLNLRHLFWKYQEVSIDIKVIDLSMS